MNNAAATWTLAGANTYTGATTVSAGILKAGVTSVPNTSGAFGGNSAVTMANTSSATLDITGFDTQIGSLTGGGTSGGNVILGAATLTVGGDNTSPAAYRGTISGNGGVSKIGSGTLTLTGPQNYATLTTSDGITNLNVALGSGASTLNANARTNLGTSQTLAALNIGSGGVVVLTAGAPALVSEGGEPVGAFADGGADFGNAAFDEGIVATEGGVAAVPEPGFASLLLAGAFCLLVRRRRK